jgi:hypothetical protein
MDCFITTVNLSNKRKSNSDRLHAYKNKKGKSMDIEASVIISLEASASKLLLDTNLEQKPESETTWPEIWSGSKCVEFKEKHTWLLSSSCKFGCDFGSYFESMGSSKLERLRISEERNKYLRRKGKIVPENYRSSVRKLKSILNRKGPK